MEAPSKHVACDAAGSPPNKVSKRVITRTPQTSIMADVAAAPPGIVCSNLMGLIYNQLVFPKLHTRNSEKQLQSQTCAGAKNDLTERVVGAGVGNRRARLVGAVGHERRDLAAPETPVACVPGGFTRSFANCRQIAVIAARRWAIPFELSLPS